MTKKQKRRLIKIAVAVLMTVLGLFFKECEMLYLAFSLFAFLAVGYDVLLKAVRGITRGQFFDENFLMAVAGMGAFICGDYTEASAVLIFYAVGEVFESYAVGKSRKNIAALLDITSDRARLEIEGELREVSAQQVDVGSIITLLPGDKIPIDGKIIEGETQIVTSALTGESVPKIAAVGDEVLSGCVNMTSTVRVKTTKAFSDSAASKVLELIELSAEKKSHSEKFITKFSKVYTPAVCALAVILALVPPAVSLAIGRDGMWLEWIKRGLTFLVISCPCALVVSVPMSFFGGISAVSRSGVLIKGSGYLEALSRVSSVAFDKTGTLTQGSFEVTEVIPEGCDEEALLSYAAAAELHSTHPIAGCILRKAEAKPNGEKITDFVNISGKGASCSYEGKPLFVGNALLMKNSDIAIPKKQMKGTAVYVAYDGVYMGCILISDSLKPTSAETLNELKRNRIKTFMLTGDKKDVADAFAEELSIDGVYSELLPEDKLSYLEKIINENTGGSTVYVGDGINDAPVLMRSDVGVAMGALGSDAAVEAADIVIMDDNPARLITAIRQSKKTMKIVRQNTVFSIGVKLLFLLLGVLGISGLWMSIFADVGVLILAVLNAMRCMKTE